MAYPRISGDVRSEFLARVKAGARPSAVAREPGMPTLSTVNGWARREPVFAAAYAAAKGQGQWRREGVVAPWAAAEILRRLGEGEAIREILKTPGMPGRDTYRRWRMMNGDFAEEVGRINRSNRSDLRDGLARRRWRDFDQATADKVLVRVGRGHGLRALAGLGEGLPGPRVIARWRRQDAEFDSGLKVAFAVALRRRRQRRLCTDALVDEIFERVAWGATLAEVARDEGMPSRGTLYAWMRTRPEFRQAIGFAREARADWLADAALDVAERPGWEAGRGREARRLLAKADRLLTRAERDRGWD